MVAARVRARSRADWLESKNLVLAPAVKGLKEPTFVTAPPDDSKRLFVLERAGVIRVADADGQLRPTPFLDLTGQVSTSTEEGMLGLAFHPRFRENGYVYVVVHGERLVGAGDPLYGHARLAGRGRPGHRVHRARGAEAEQVPQRRDARVRSGRIPVRLDWRRRVVR